MRFFSASAGGPRAASFWPDPFVAGFLVMIGGTVAFAAGYSLLYAFGLIGSVSRGATLQAMLAVLGDRAVWVSLAFSIGLTLVTLALALASALAAALLLGPQLRRAPLGIAIFLPLAVPGVVAALVSYELLGGAGLLSRLAQALGWIAQPAQFPALVFDRLGIGIVCTHWAMVTPFLVIVLDRLIEHERIPLFRQQAQALGASRWQSLYKVGLPLLARGALPLCAVYGAVLMAAFEVPLLVGARYPAMVSVEIQTRIQQFDLSRRPEGFALAALYLLLVSAAWWCAGQRFSKRRAAR